MLYGLKVLDINPVSSGFLQGRVWLRSSPQLDGVPKSAVLFLWSGRIPRMEGIVVKPAAGVHFFRAATTKSNGILNRKCPLLCKEFIIDAWQIYNARVKGADAVLLIAAVFPDLDIKYMTKICKLLGLAALVEVHDEREMDRVIGIEGIQLIGINNRNLETFEVDINNTKQLMEGKRGDMIRQKDIIVVGESGLFTPDDIAFVQNAGVKAVLVGESIVKQEDPKKGIAGLFGKDISV